MIDQPRALKIQNSDGSLMVFICMSMPGDMRHLLFLKLVASLGRKEHIMEVSCSGEEPFNCAHFSWYNRYTKLVSRAKSSHLSSLNLYLQGAKAPLDTHPHMLRQGDGSCINIT